MQLAWSFFIWKKIYISFLIKVYGCLHEEYRYIILKEKWFQSWIASVSGFAMGKLSKEIRFKFVLHDLSNEHVVAMFKLTLLKEIEILKKKIGVAC